MRLNLILLTLLVVLGVGISFLLIPRDKDVALLQLRSDETDEARRVLLEQYDSGDRSVAVIASLAEIALLEGEVPIAVQLLEDYVAANPKDATARRRLAEYYRFDQRRDAYVTMLAEVVSRDGTPEERRLLTDLYRLRGQYTELRAALADLIARGIANERDHWELAGLAASAGKFEQSLAVTEQMWRAYPDSFDARTMRLYVMVASAAGKAELAEQSIARLAAGDAGLQGIVPVILEVSDRGQAGLGLRLLAQFEDDLPGTPALLVAWARMQQSLNQDAVALERLQALEDAGDLPDLAVPVLIDLALQRGDIDLLDRIFADRNMADFAEVRLRAVADLAVFNRRTRLLSQFIEQTPERLETREPALVAEVLIALGRQDEALGYVDRARAAPDRRLDQLLRLARAEIRLGQDDAAAATLDRVAALPELDSAATRGLAYLYLETERTTQGLAAFERLRRERPSLAADEGWARLAAREGRDSELMAWMADRQALGEDLLVDIVDLSSPDRAPRAALEAATRLFNEHPGPDSRRRYAEALMANGDYTRAIPLLAELLPGTDQDAETYVAALLGARRQDEALDWLEQRRAEGPLPERIADDYIYLAFERGDPANAYAEAERQKLHRLDEEVLAFLVQRAAADGRMALIDRIVDGADADFLPSRPVLAARIALARENKAEARRWADRAMALPDLRNAERLDLAAIYSALDEPAQTIAILETLASDPTTPTFALAELARAYLELDRAEDGLATFRDLKERRSELAVQEAWARLETQAGEPKAVRDWLKATNAISAQALSDIYYAAVEEERSGLALDAARRFAADYPGTESQRLLAFAWLDAGQAARALPVLEKLLPGDADIAEAYVGALRNVGRQGDALTFLTERAGDAKQPERLADDYISLALELDRADLAFAEARQQDVSRFDDGTISALVERAAAEEAFDIVDQVLAQTGPEFFETRPVLAARIALARDLPVEARGWAEKAEGRDDLRTTERVALANVWSSLGESEKALVLLRDLAHEPNIPAFAIADLGAAYLALGRANEGLPLLRDLRDKRTEPLVQAAWARLEAAAGEPDRVLEWLAEPRQPDAQTLADIHYLAAERKADKLAFEAGRLYYERYPGPESRRIRATTLLARGRAEDALPILKELLPGDDEIAEAYSAALVATDQQARALAFLTTRTTGEKIPVRIADDYMAIAIALDQPKLAYAEARRHDLSDFDDDTIASLAENAAEDGDFRLLDQIVDQTGEAFFAERPVMAARIEYARGNEIEARRWADTALATEGLDNTRQLRLAKVYSDLGDLDQSLDLLEGLAADPETPAFAMADLAAQYLQLGRAAQGLPVFRELVQRRSESLVQEGWARIETKAGDPARVLRWLNDAEEPSRQVLLDLSFLASEREANRLALAAADRLFETFPGNEARLIRARALTAVGRGAEAIALLKPMLPGSPDVRAAYVAALGQGGSAADLKAFARDALDDPDLDPTIRSALLFGLLENGGAEIALPRLRELARRDPQTWEAAYLQALREAGSRDEQIGVLTARLDRNPPAEQRDLLLYELLETAGEATALPYLNRAAESEPNGVWPAAYEAALDKLGRRDELADWLEVRAGLPGLAAKARREIAFRLLDLGARGAAERQFLRLAANAGPNAPDVQQLMFLWGPKPPERGLDWLTERARRATGDARGGWLQLLSNARAFDRVVRIAGADRPERFKDPTLAPLVQSLIQMRRRSEVADVLNPIIARTDKPRDLLQMADWAEQALQSSTAVAAYRRAIGRIGDDPEALLKAARAFTFAGSAELSVETLERYFRTSGNKAATDHRPWYYYGLSLAQMNRQPEARAAYREMLRVMDRNGAEDFESRRMRATGLEAIGNGDEAVRIYEGLLAERPRDRSLVADFASLLIELRRYDRAEALLGTN